MIEALEIRNFRNFRELKASGWKLVNVIVGDNAVGKTALLEAIFLAGASSPQHAFNLRGWRGFDGSAQGNARDLERALWGQFFNDFDTSKTIEISLTGNSGDGRSVVLSRESGPISLPLEGGSDDSTSHDSLMSFEWKGPGARHGVGRARIVDGKIEVTGIPDSPMQTVFFPANAATAARETAARFSSLSKSNEETALVDEMRRLFPNINSVSVELEAGVPMVFIGLRGNKEKMPVNLISGGTNRVTSILLALAASPGGAVIIDEIDNGIFHSRMTGVWAATLALAKKYKTQVFASTHDLECLEALVTAAKEDLQDVGLWRLEQTQEGPSLLQFSGEDLKASIDYGAEVRGGEDSGRS